MNRAPLGIAVFVVLAGFCAAQEAATQAVTRPAMPTPDTLSDLITLIEDPKNPPEARKRAARLLLMQGWSETPPRLAAILSGQNAGGKVAVASALAELPQFLDAAYLGPLTAMLGENEAEVRHAAARALAGYRDGGVVPRLRRQLVDPDAPQRARLGAVTALGLMTSRGAIDALAAVLTDRDPVVAAAALAAFQQATAMDFRDDAAEAEKWWNATRDLTDEEWQRLEIERLMQRDREMRARLDAVEGRLAKVLETGFQRASDAERAALLSEYLSDSSATIRTLGLRLVQRHLDDGRTPDSLPGDLLVRIRDLMNSPDPREQAAAVQTVARFRNPQDAETFIALLATARNRALRLSLINGLGYVGNGAAAEALLGALDLADPELATEVVAALGRLAERGALRDAPREDVVRALARTFAETQPAHVALRERLLWAMGNLADASFGPAFAAALDRAEAVAVRLNAVRGIAGLDDPKLADALLPAVSDPDPGVRKAAIDTLATLGAADRHLQAIWSRLTSPPETEETVRQAAWRAALLLLEKRPPAEIEEWITRLPGEGRLRAQRTIDLLQRLLRTAEAESPANVARLATLRTRLAAQYVLLEQPGEALLEYTRALDVAAKDAAAAERVARDALRFALVSDRYDPNVAQMLRNVCPPVTPAALWDVIHTELTARLTAENAAQIETTLSAVEQDPPCAWPEDIREGFRQLRERIGRLRTPTPEPNSQPASPGSSAAPEAR